MKDFIHHIFLPRSSNNHRAKLLHHKSLLFTSLLLILFSFLLVDLRSKLPTVLGISADVSLQQLLILTNEKRQENGLPLLIIDSELSQAATDKANNMFAQDYWAHNSPDGKTPWVFIKGAGYNYIYAGENLARGFTTASGVIDAWMNSPEHKKNMLSSNYKDVGFAVVTGKLNGEETVLVVEMLGSTNIGSVANNELKKPVEVAVASGSSSSVLNTEESVPVSKAGKNDNIANNSKPANNTLEISRLVLEAKNAITPAPLINSASFTSSFAKGLLSLFILVLILDMFVVEKKKIVRLVGHNLDHIFFLTLILFLITIIARGVVL